MGIHCFCAQPQKQINEKRNIPCDLYILFGGIYIHHFECNLIWRFCKHNILSAASYAFPTGNIYAFIRNGHNLGSHALLYHGNTYYLKI